MLSDKETCADAPDTEMIVRRFTDEMEVETDLDSHTRTAQQSLDIETEESERRRFDYLYKTAGGSLQ